jgi:hypothetical protein
VVSVSDFIKTGPNGLSTPDFGKIAEVGVGATFGAILTGIASVVLGIFDVPLSLLAGLANFLERGVSIIANTPGILIEEGFLTTWMFVIESGPAGLVVALGIGLAAAFVFRWVIVRG